jgi:hypothetical protein
MQQRRLQLDTLFVGLKALIKFLSVLSVLGGSFLVVYREKGSFLCSGANSFQN